MKHGDRDEQPKKIMWLAGPAGSGKTAIAGSVAETCKMGQFLAASFFFSSFSGSADRCSKRYVVATLAYHLAQHVGLHQFKAELLNAIEHHPDIFHKDLDEQVQCLLLKPFRMIYSQYDRSAWPKGIVLDGLDEVKAKQYHDTARGELRRTDEDDQLEILNALYTLVTDPAFPFRIIIASRPEMAIHEFFSTIARDITTQLFLDSKYNPNADIELFLKSKCTVIRRRFGISDALWPGQDVINRILDMSSGQFIIPATIVRYISAGVPQRQLDNIMQLQWVNTGTKNPLAVVDALYTHILHRSPDPFLAAKWLVVISCCAHFTHPALFWKRFFEDVEGEFNHLLGPLSSLVFIPPAGDCTSPVTIYHKSFADYLSSKKRCGDFYADDAAVFHLSASRCVAVLQSACLFPFSTASADVRFGCLDQGPRIPLRSSSELDQFLRSYFRCIQVGGGRLSDVLHPNSYIMQQFPLYLSEASRVDLTCCDVSWWTHLLLTEGAFSHNRRTFGLNILWSILYKIHVGMVSLCTPGMISFLLLLIVV